VIADHLDRSNKGETQASCLGNNGGMNTEWFPPSPGLDKKLRIQSNISGLKIYNSLETIPADIASNSGKLSFFCIPPGKSRKGLIVV
jgi:hypothetical protein